MRQGTRQASTSPTEIKNMVFDIVIPITRGAVFACRFIRNEELNAVGSEKGITINITMAHGVFGQVHKDAARRMANHMHIKLTRGKLAPCKHCAKSKAKQKNASKEIQFNKAAEVCERTYMDLSIVTVPKQDGSTFDISGEIRRSSDLRISPLPCFHLRQRWKYLSCHLSQCSILSLTALVDSSS